MSTAEGHAELSLRSGLWRMLVQRRSPDCTVPGLMSTCRHQFKDRQLASYFEPGAEDLFRSFVRESPWYFHYDAERDTVAVAEDSPCASVDHWLVRYLALQIQDADGGLDIRSDALASCVFAAPRCISDHLVAMYDGSLEIFFWTHPRDFTIQEGRTLVWMTPSFRRSNVEVHTRERNVVLFFDDLLQKIGATKDNPCDLRTLRRYVPLMKSEERNVLDDVYHRCLDVFCLLYPSRFATTGADKRRVFLVNYDPHYCEALFLKQQLRECRCFSGPPSKVSLVELTVRAKYSSSPAAPSFIDCSSAIGRVRYITKRHPAIFCVDIRNDEIWLRQEPPPWPNCRWNADAELLAVAYFIDVIKCIDATSPSRAICLNYMVYAARAAPRNCRDYLESVYPGLQVIELFHMHPGVFYLCSVNRICLRTTQEAPSAEAAPEDTETESGRGNAEEQAVRYVAKLLKCVRDLNPDLLAVCVETAPSSVRSYCMALVEGRLQSVIESGRAALSAEEELLLSVAPLKMCAKTTSEVSTQTVDEPAAEPVTYGSENGEGAATRNRDNTEAAGQKACGFAVSGNMEAKEEASTLSPANAIAAYEVSGSTAAVETTMFVKREPYSGGEQAPQRIIWEPEKQEAADHENATQFEGRKACSPVVSGSSKANKESVAARLFKAIASHAVSVTRPQSENRKSMSGGKNTSKKGEPSSALSGSGYTGGHQQGAALFAAVERPAMTARQNLDSETSHHVNG